MRCPERCAPPPCAALASSARREEDEDIDQHDQATAPRLLRALLSMLPLAICLCAGLVVVGSLGPWVTAFEGKLNQRGVPGDGITTLILGLMAGGLALWPLVRADRPAWPPLVASICFALSLVVADGVEMDIGDADAVSVGWGLRLTLLASIAGGALALWWHVVLRRAGREAGALVPQTDRER
jgi:hypothetical protein